MFVVLLVVVLALLLFLVLRAIRLQGFSLRGPWGPRCSYASVVLEQVGLRNWTIGILKRLCRAAQGVITAVIRALERRRPRVQKDLGFEGFFFKTVHSA